MQTAVEARPTERDESLDFVKFVAIALVIMVHVSASGYVKFGPQWNAALVYRSLSSICVPLFFLATGALLLRRDASPASVFRRVRHIGIPAILWSCVYLTRITFVEHGVIGNWALRILSAPAAIHLWFVYTIIGYYICLPLFTGFYRHSTDGQRWLVLGAWFVGASVNPFCYGLFGTGPLIGIDLSFVPLYAGYPIIGAMLYERFRHTGSRGFLIAGAVALLALALTVAGANWSAMLHGAPTLTFTEYWSPLVILASVAAFIALQFAFDRVRSTLMRRVVASVAKRTMSIYFVHLLLVQLFFMYARPTMFSASAWGFYPLAGVLTLLGSTLIVAIMQKIPGLRIMCPD